MSFPIEGTCPVCGGPTLETSADDGRIRCAAPECPRPSAAAEILADPETQHIVTFTEDGFTIRHPLRERLDDALMQCQVHADFAASAGPPAVLGRYRVVSRVMTWGGVSRYHFERLP